MGTQVAEAEKLFSALFSKAKLWCPREHAEDGIRI
jgi:hypothetical protein